MSETSKHSGAARFLLLSDFNIQNLARLLALNASVDPVCHSYGQVLQALLSPDSATWPQDISGTIVWTSPSCVSKAYDRVRNFEEAKLEDILRGVDEFASALISLPEHIQHIFVASWSPLQKFDMRRGLMDLDERFGLSRSLMLMNLQLADGVRADQRVHIFDSSRWLAAVKRNAFDARLWYLSKTPYSLEVFREAARDFNSALLGIQGHARKLLVLDLDNTLWGGVVGDVGWQRLRLGGHDAIGEAYRDFQLALKALTNRGILLAIASRNDEAIALEAIRSHPEMALTLDHFAGWRINWQDKAQNVLELAEELNLGLDAIVFLDDNPVERDRMKAGLPEVLVPEWPSNPFFYPDTLRGLDCFDTPAMTEEDRSRASMYASEKNRRCALQQLPSLEKWLNTLEPSVTVEELNEGNVERTVQLLNKTNQMNLRTRRSTVAELEPWAAAPEHSLLVFRVSDRFGEYGLVGIGSFTVNPLNANAEIEDFVLSCRVMGRQIEQTMLHVLAKYARQHGARSLTAEYIPTARNAPCRLFFEASGMQFQPGAESFFLNLHTDLPLPECVTVNWSESKDSLTPDTTAEAPLHNRIA